MASKKPGRIRNIGKPDRANTRRQSNPQTPQDKKQAIADDIEGAIYAYQPVLAMESAVRQNDMAIVMGIGSPNLKLFIDQHEAGYREAVGSRGKASKAEKEAAPQLDQVSRDTTVDGDRKGTKPNKRQPRTPTGKPPTRRRGK